MPDQSRARWARTLGCCLLPASAASFAPRTAAAEERLHFELVPDSALYELTLQRKSEPVESARLELYGGAGASILRGLATGPWRPLRAAAGIGAGFWASPTWHLALRSELALPIPALTGEAQPTGLRFGDLEGAHRLRGFAGLNEVHEGEGGADLEIEGSMLHAGSFATSYLRRDVGPHPFWDASATATLWPRRAFESEAAAVLPVSVTLRRVAIDRPEGGAGFASQRFSSGFGIHPYTPEISQGWFELVGAAYERSRFDAAPGAPRPRLGGVDRLDLRFLSVDRIVGGPERDMAFSVSFGLGGAWLWDKVTKEATSAFTFTLAGGLHGYLGHGHPEDRIGAGFGVSRGAGFLADGSALTRRWRFELFADVDVLDHRTGGAIRGAMEHLDRPLAAPNARDGGFRHVFASEWYLAFVPFLQMGLNHASSNQCLSSPIDDGRWCHQIGAFLRLGGRWSHQAPEEPQPTSNSID